jgi:hypothetical protein
MNVCVGLFGTCGKSKWRDPFIKTYTDGIRCANIEFFNPNVVDWKPENAVSEAKHLAEDSVILFPITSETYATGSLAETGFSILNAIKLDDRRDFVIFVEQKLDDELMTKNPELAKESLRARALVKQHLKKLNLANLYNVDSLDDMLTLSIKLYFLAKERFELEKFRKPLV